MLLFETEQLLVDTSVSQPIHLASKTRRGSGDTFVVPKSSTCLHLELFLQHLIFFLAYECAQES